MTVSLSANTCLALSWAAPIKKLKEQLARIPHRIEMLVGEADQYGIRTADVFALAKAIREEVAAL